MMLPTRPTPRRLTAREMKDGMFQRKSYGTINICLGWHNDAYFVSAFDTVRGEYRFTDHFRFVAQARKHFDHAEALLVAGHTS